MNKLNPSPFMGFDKKVPHYYKGIQMKTDTNLHEQLSWFIQRKTQLFNIQTRRPRVLDWGCGEGAFSQRLYDLGCDVVAADVDTKNFKAQGPVFYPIDFNQPEEVERFIQEYSNSFDLVVAIEVIEHVKNPWEFIQNLYRISHQKTHVVITTPNISSWWGRFWFLLTGNLWGFSQQSWDNIGHINPIGELEMVNILNETGFECLEVFPGGNLPIIWLYNWKRTLVSMFMFPIYLVMKGQKKGWALCYHVLPKF